MIFAGAISSVGPERLPYKQEVTSSNLVSPIKNSGLYGVVVQSGLTRWPVKPEIAGSNPVGPAIFEGLEDSLGPSLVSVWRIVCLLVDRITLETVIDNR